MTRAPGTDRNLVDASHDTLQGLLSRKRRKANLGAGTCGTAAKVDVDESAPNGLKSTSSVPEDDGFNQGTEDDADFDWEEVGRGTDSANQSEATEPLVVTIQRGTDGAPKRTGVTKQEREAALRIHRAHVLCLLGRGLLYDAAATDELVQAVMLSLTPADMLEMLARPATGLEPVLGWFRSTFHLVGGPMGFRSGKEHRGASVGAPDDFNNALEATLEAAKSGRAAVVKQLCDAAVQRRGSAEQLAGLFVALLRAAGCCARSVRVLAPLPLNPRDARQASQPFGAEEGPAKKATKSGRIRSTSSNLDSATSSSGTANTAPVRKRKPRASGTRAGARPASRAVGTEAVVHETQTEPAPEPARTRRRPADKRVIAREVAAKVPVPAKPQRRNRGDEELEHQLALAMAATAFQAPTSEVGPVVPSARGGDASDRGGGAVTTSGPVPGIGCFWAEVLVHQDGHQPRWIHADPLTGVLDRPGDVEELQTRVLAYAVGFAGGGAKDLTRRYARDWPASAKLRDGAWYEATCAPLARAEREYGRRQTAVGAERQRLERRHGQVCTDAPGKAPTLVDLPGPRCATSSEEKWCGDAGNVAVSDEVGRCPAPHGPHGLQLPRGSPPGPDPPPLSPDVIEDDELARRALSHEHVVPGTQAGFRNHPLYVLARHIPRHQALRPGSKPCGMHRGEPYYARRALADVHTADRWRRMGEEVVPEELDAPVKVLERRGFGGSGAGRRPAASRTASGAEDGRDAGDDKGDDAFGSPLGGDAATAVKYYGPWQTKKAERPRCEDGHVPRTRQGNVEVPPLMHALPLGAVHLDLPGILPVCHSLGVDAAPALAGFEHRGGRAVPVIRGVVIAEENQASVLEVYWEMAREREERATRKKRAEARAAWKLLLRSLLARVRVRRHYGESGVSGTDHSMQDAALVLLDPGTELGRGGRPGAAIKRNASPVGGTASVLDQEKGQIDVSGVEREGSGPAQGTRGLDQGWSAPLDQDMEEI